MRLKNVYVPKTAKFSIYFSHASHNHYLCVVYRRHSREPPCQYRCIRLHIHTLIINQLESRWHLTDRSICIAKPFDRADWLMAVVLSKEYVHSAIDCAATSSLSVDLHLGHSDPLAPHYIESLARATPQDKDVLIVQIADGEGGSRGVTGYIFCYLTICT